jgi:RNA polymerase sigma factor (sigma-70 family)
MSIMDELENVRALRADIESLRTRRARLRAAMEGRSSWPRLGSRGTAECDRIAAAVAQLEELDAQLLEQIVQAECKVLDVEQAVDALPGPQRRIVRLRYLEGLQWREVAEIMHYSPRRCMQLMNEALQELLCD